MKADCRKLKMLIATRTMTLGELSDSAGVSRQTVRHAYNGNTVRPDTLDRIAAALGVDVAEIMAEEA